MRHELYCYIRLIGAYIRGRTVHRFGILLYIFGIMLVYLSSFAGIWVILNRFHTIGDWEFGQIAFIYILTLISYGVRNLFLIQFRNLSTMVKMGEIDQILIRPMNPFLYIMGNRFELGGFSHITLGMVLLFLLRDQFGIVWNLTNLIYIVLAILSAALVQGAITVAIGTTAFFITDATGLATFYNGLREFIWYPVTLYNNVIKFILFLVCPLAFASYVPAGIFLDHPEYLILPPWVWKASLLVGLVLFVGAYQFWKLGLRKYHSTGS